MSARLIAAAVAALALLAGMAWIYEHGKAVGVAACEADQRDELDAWRVNAEAAAELYEAERAKKAPQYRTVTVTKERVIHANPDYAACRLDADGLRLLRDNAAIANTGKPAPAAGAGPQ
ncbi:hypothetical protein AU476_07580 [Cupriavidus sp. UYMSc13B]|nr:hypothetical protein AU476_07580 [Cupriavidus sp. UYMSc13B]